MLKRVKKLKLNFININSNFSLFAFNKKFNTNNFVDVIINPITKCNYPLYYKYAIKSFAKKASKRKGEESKNNYYENNNKKNPKKKIIEIKEKANKSEVSDVEDDVNLKENNKSSIKANGKFLNKNDNEETNHDKKAANDVNEKSNAEVLKCMIIHPVLSDR